MVTEALDECSLELTRIACNLCCITSLLLLLARLSTGMTMEEMLTLMSALPPVMLDGQDQVRRWTADSSTSARTLNTYFLFFSRVGKRRRTQL